MWRNVRVHLSLEDLAIYGSIVGSQIGLAVVSILMGDQLAKRTNPLTFVVYSTAIAAFILSPFAFFLEQKKRTKLDLPLIGQVFLISLCGVSTFQALLYMGMKDTSPPFSMATTNLAPAIIFFMAWILGMENVDVKRVGSRFKIAGTIICVCGAMVMSFIHGPPLTHLWSSLRHSEIPSHKVIITFLQERDFETTKIRGCIYLFLSVALLSYAIILKAKTVMKFPAPLSLIAMTAFLGSVETAVLITIEDMGIHQPSWALDRSGVVAVAFDGIVCHGITMALQLWCIQKRGPVFLAIFSPVGTVCSTILLAVFLGDALHLGSAMGMLMIFAGLYAVLWGKSKDNDEGKLVTWDEEKQLNKAEKDLRSKDANTPLLR